MPAAAVDPKVERILAERAGEARRRFEEAVGRFEAGRFEEAETEVRASLKALTTAEGHHLLGLVLRELRRPEEAERAFLSAVKGKPSFAEAWLNLGTLRYFRGELPGAIEAYEAYLKHSGEAGAEETRGMVEARIREMRGK